MKSKMPWLVKLTTKNYKTPWHSFVFLGTLNILIIILIVFLFNNIYANTDMNKIYIMDNFIETINEYSDYAKKKIPLTKISDIKKDIKIILKKYKKHWSKKNIKKFARTLQVGEMEFNIDYRVILSIAAIESNYKINARNYNKNKSIDYGLTQINGPNWKRLSKQSYKILDKHEISYKKHKYDIALNTMNCFIYFNWSRYYLKKKKRFYIHKWIKAYNVGVRGAFMKSKRLKERRQAYYKKYKKNKGIF